MLEALGNGSFLLDLLIFFNAGLMHGGFELIGLGKLQAEVSHSLLLCFEFRLHFLLELSFASLGGNDQVLEPRVLLTPLLLQLLRIRVLLSECLELCLKLAVLCFGIQSDGGILPLMPLHQLLHLLLRLLQPLP